MGTGQPGGRAHFFQAADRAFEFVVETLACIQIFRFRCGGREQQRVPFVEYVDQCDKAACRPQHFVVEPGYGVHHYRAIALGQFDVIVGAACFHTQWRKIEKYGVLTCTTGVDTPLVEGQRDGTCSNIAELCKQNRQTSRTRCGRRDLPNAIVVDVISTIVVRTVNGDNLAMRFDGVDRGQKIFALESNSPQTPAKNLKRKNRIRVA